MTINTHNKYVTKNEQGRTRYWSNLALACQTVNGRKVDGEPPPDHYCLLPSGRPLTREECRKTYRAYQDERSRLWSEYAARRRDQRLDAYSSNRESEEATRRIELQAQMAVEASLNSRVDDASGISA